MPHLLSPRYTATEREVEPRVAAHVAFLARHHAAGVFLLSGQTVPVEDGGAFLVAGVDRATAGALTERDPFVRAGVARYTVTTVEPGRVHPAPAPLLGAPAERVRPPTDGGRPAGGAGGRRA